MSASPLRRILWEPGPPSRERPLRRLKHLLIGKPIPSVHEREHRVSALIGLGAFASDAVSSVAYATEEMLLVLILAGTAALAFGPVIAAVIAAVLIIVVSSYYQTVQAYPTGGGAYTVARENLGTSSALVAGAALVVDYGVDGRGQRCGGCGGRDVGDPRPASAPRGVGPGRGGGLDPG